MARFFKRKDRRGTPFAAFAKDFALPACRQAGLRLKKITSRFIVFAVKPFRRFYTTQA